MQPFEISYGKKIWKDCEDERPWLVVEQHLSGIYRCFPISGQCYQGHYCFELQQGHPDFAATGLSKTCFVLYESFIELEQSEFTRKKGSLQGALLAAFREEAGV